MKPRRKTVRTIHGTAQIAVDFVRAGELLNVGESAARQTCEELGVVVTLPHGGKRVVVDLLRQRIVEKWVERIFYVRADSTSDNYVIAEFMVYRVRTMTITEQSNWGRSLVRRYHRRRTVVTAFVAVAMMALCATLAAQATPQSQSDSGKPAWLWTTEERIAKRVNPAEREARRARGLEKARAVSRGWTPIDGSVEPELFLPVELITRLVLKTDAPHERMREMYRAAIFSHGWSFEEFWDVLDSAAAPYLSLMQQGAVLQRQSQGRADLSQLGPQTCAASVDLLETAYESFGQQKFDEFLYRTIAPPIRITVADHADTADALRKKARECR